MRRVLLLLPAAGYANQDFVQAADRLGVELVTCADFCHRLAPAWGLPPLMSVPFDQPDVAAPQVLAALEHPVDAVLATDDHGLALAALLNEKLGLPGNPVAAVAQLADKLRFRQLQQRVGLACPAFHSLHNAQDMEAVALAVGFPMVVKARRLNASRGVIRVNNRAELRSAVSQIQRIQARVLRDANDLGLLVEAFIPGVEVALEGVMQDRQLRVLAVFDKPDPLNGPTFEETRYVTPSLLPADIQAQLAAAVRHACEAAGVREGPIHAEARINAEGIWLLEIAPRGIGGLCGRILQATLGFGAAELALRHAAGLPLPEAPPANHAAGVMMIPIPTTGLLKSVAGVAAARAVAHITGIEITAQPGQLIAPPPEGASYLGFIFSRADSPQAAADALLAAHARLEIHIQPTLR